MTYNELYEIAMQMDKENTADNVLLNDSRIIAFMLDNCDIAVSEKSEFFVRPLTGDYDGRIMRRFWLRRWGEVWGRVWTDPKRLTGEKNFAFNGAPDFGHTAPGWKNVFKYGLGGLRERIANRTGEALNPDFVEAELMVLDAASRFVLRAAQAAEDAGRTRMAEGLRHLSTGTPRNLFEGFQLTLLYYCLQQEFETSNIRTMGRLDQLLLPLYEKETDMEYVHELTHQYMVEIDALKATANLPFALGGTDADGVSQVNAMSYEILNAYAATKLPDTKLHILWTPDMPDDFLGLCMQCIRDGGNSLVFINNQKMVDGLVKLGLENKHAVDFSIVGCYESSGGEEVPCSASGKVGMAKALEVTLHGGKDGLTGQMVGLEQPVDFTTFDDLYKAFLANAEYFCKESIRITDLYEREYKRVHCAPFFSATLDSCIENGGDAYCDYAAKYNNSSINLIGFATAVDSLYAIRKLVYEDKRVTLQELIEILDKNWEGHEVLQGIVWNKFPKFGTNNDDVDALAADLASHMSSYINNVPNVKGGVYRMGILTIHWRVKWGEHAAASADGRFSGQTLSQNASATLGMDKEGPTAHMLSLAKMPSEDAVNGLVLDIDMHSSMVQGNNGVNMLVATLKTFMEAGGQTVHYNILDTKTLRDAQIHPELYPTLQVRRCGWNVLFKHLSKRDQDEFIERAEMHEV